MFTETYKRNRKGSSNAIILHLDGDKKYAKRALNYYNSLNLKAIVENIPEKNQSYEITNLLETYKPNILVITGHDKMYKKGQDLYKIENYKNSKYFMQVVKKAREWEKSEEKLIIFAGACESFYEALMIAGANFASSPARIMIEYRDPLIIASKIAMESSKKNITMKELKPHLRSNYNGIGGKVAKGQKKDWQISKNEIVTFL